MTDKELLEQFQLLAGMIGDVEVRLTKKIDDVDVRLTKKIDDVDVRLTKKIDESETRTKIFIENTVTKKIESLFDGYKLTHEKQYELERRMEKLEQALADLQNRIA